MAVNRDECAFTIQCDAKKRFLEIAFRAIPHWDGLQMWWEFVVPVTGVFSNDDVADKSGCIVKREVLKEAREYEDMAIDQ